jgi:hypothetical protein
MYVSRLYPVYKELSAGVFQNIQCLKSCYMEVLLYRYNVFKQSSHILTCLDNLCIWFVCSFNLGSHTSWKSQCPPMDCAVWSSTYVLFQYWWWWLYALWNLHSCWCAFLALVSKSYWKCCRLASDVTELWSDVFPGHWPCQYRMVFHNAFCAFIINLWDSLWNFGNSFHINTATYMTTNF